MNKKEVDLLNKLTGNLASSKTIKTLFKPDQADVIPPLNQNEHINTEETDKINILNNFCTEQTLLDKSQANLRLTIKILQTNLILSLIHLNMLEKL